MFYVDACRWRFCLVVLILVVLCDVLVICLVNCLLCWLLLLVLVDFVWAWVVCCLSLRVVLVSLLLAFTDLFCLFYFGLSFCWM